MTMKNDTAWLLKKAALEDNGCVSVGGLLNRVAEADAEESNSPLRKMAFARFVELSRRQRRLSVEELAERADIDVEEILSIEEGECDAPEPRTVYRLSSVLQVPQQQMMALSGLARPRDARLQEAMVRFAARSEPMHDLSAEEDAALREFVTMLAESSGGG